MSGVCAGLMLLCGLWAHNVSLGESQDSLIVCTNEISNLECRSVGHGICSGILQTVFQVCWLQIVGLVV